MRYAVLFLSALFLAGPFASSAFASGFDAMVLKSDARYKKWYSELVIQAVKIETEKDLDGFLANQVDPFLALALFNEGFENLSGLSRTRAVAAGVMLTGCLIFLRNKKGIPYLPEEWSIVKITRNLIYGDKWIIKYSI